nr:MAG TPA: hypothetical protein [Caudoviricetes sp.]
MYQDVFICKVNSHYFLHRNSFALLPPNSLTHFVRLMLISLTSYFRNVSPLFFCFAMQI